MRPLHRGRHARFSHRKARPLPWLTRPNLPAQKDDRPARTSPTVPQEHHRLGWQLSAIQDSSPRPKIEGTERPNRFSPRQPLYIVQRQPSRHIRFASPFPASPATSAPPDEERVCVCLARAGPQRERRWPLPNRPASSASDCCSVMRPTPLLSASNPSLKPTAMALAPLADIDSIRAGNHPERVRNCVGVAGRRSMRQAVLSRSIKEVSTPSPGVMSVASNPASTVAWPRQHLQLQTRRGGHQCGVHTSSPSSASTLNYTREVSHSHWQRGGGIRE